MIGREAYFSLEGRPHYNEDDMYFYDAPIARDLALYPPTFIVNNINLVETYDVKEIYTYVSELFANKSADFRNELIDLALTKLQDNVNLSVKTAVELAFKEINHIYGGSASDLINEELV